MLSTVINCVNSRQIHLPLVVPFGVFIPLDGTCAYLALPSFTLLSFFFSFSILFFFPFHPIPFPSFPFPFLSFSFLFFPFLSFSFSFPFLSFPFLSFPFLLPRPQTYAADRTTTRTDSQLVTLKICVPLIVCVPKHF